MHWRGNWILRAALGLCLALPLAASAQELRQVGIPTDQMNSLASEQENTQWCWAASIQMALSKFGVKLTQEQIVRRTYGVDPFGHLPNWAANFDTISRNLHGWAVDQDGQRCQISCVANSGLPEPQDLVDALKAGHPVILAISTPNGGGHAIVCTAASYIDTPGGPDIQSIVVRDPWPSANWSQTRGREEFTASDLASRVTGYWIVSVEKTGTATHDQPAVDPQPRVELKPELGPEALPTTPWMKHFETSKLDQPAENPGFTKERN